MKDRLSDNDFVLMTGAQKLRRSAVELGLLLALCLPALALNPALDVSQYAHKTWKISDGFFKGIIYSIAQTQDGYLWLGTEFGLVRFDGVRPMEWAPPSGERLPDNEIRKLLVTRDGTLWIGTRKGLASWKGGKLTRYPQLAGWQVFALLEDHEGTLWAGGLGIPNGKLCAIHNGSVRCDGEDGSFGRAVFSVYEDSKGRLWVGADKRVWRWKPGPRKLYPTSGPHTVQGFTEGDDGTLMISWRGAIWRFVDGKTEMAYAFPATARQSGAEKLLRD